MGWDIQGGTLGFLAEKASVSTIQGNLGLCDSHCQRNVEILSHQLMKQGKNH